jgi:hypothetical protein
MAISPRSTSKRPIQAPAEATSPSAPLLRGAELEAEIIAIASALVPAINALIAAVVDPSTGPVAVAQAFGVDKVLASRVLKALRRQDHLAALSCMPGPEPLRSLVRSAQKRGIPPQTAASAAAAIDDFQRLIDVQIGDRSLLDALLSAWIPESRAEFELRRKQAAFKALSQLKGVQAGTIIATCIISPAADPALMDVAWIHGLVGLHRVRPGVVVKMASRRMSGEPNARKAQTIDGRAIDEETSPLVPEYCSAPTPQIEVRRVKESLFYTLGGDGFGAGSAVDVTFVEINRAELKRPVPLSPGQRERGENRGAYFFAEVAVPAQALQFDIVMHSSLFPGQDPALRIHDTAFDGVADAFDPRRDLDALDMLECFIPLGTGLSRARSSAAAQYPDLLSRSIRALDRAPEEFRIHRCSIEYPLYGSQISALFPTLH